MLVRILGALALAVVCNSAIAAVKINTSAPHGADSYIVRVPEGVTSRAFLKELGIQKSDVIDSIPQLHVLILKNHPASPTAQMTANQISALSRAPYVQINRTRQFLQFAQDQTVSRDQEVTARESAQRSMLWGINAVHAPEAWAITKGEGTVVAVSDTGLFHHGSLKPNIYRNLGEVGLDANGKSKEKNKVDDDHNGYVDDVNGWDFAANIPSNVDSHYHGTHVAGTIAARDGKNAVVTGVAPRASIFASSFISSDGNGTDVGGAKSLIYAVDRGARIINCSWGGMGESAVITDAIKYAQSKGVLIVAAAGNNGVNTDKNFFVPADVDLDNVISVGATQSFRGDRAWFSNFGAQTVDLAAPGYEITSTANPWWGFHYLYRTISGTSMAAPHVSGVAALIWSKRPDLSYQDVRRLLLSSAEHSKFWEGKSVSEGVARADFALQGL